ncbi:hypothetical protein T07_7818 [Trichinella nelsoni]|uniref:Uncharacterized protein n=1 Tax=Trichinella nelsoni TaxID=6336 RepID=A0A0V0RLK5_9BILA|nr:hypothetical protein T07_7818 [Trichinella nelsoni]
MFPFFIYLTQRKMGLECVEKNIFTSSTQILPTLSCKFVANCPNVGLGVGIFPPKIYSTSCIHCCRSNVMIVCAFYATGRFQQQSLCVSGKQVACCQKLDWGQQSQASGSKLMPHRVKPDG